MRELLALTQDLGVSRPIFRLVQEEDGDIKVSHDMEYAYVPTYGNDCLSLLIRNNYNESFSVEKKQFIISREDIANRAMEDIKSTLTSFIHNNIKMKNPRQSKLYKFFYYESRSSGKNLDDVLVMLYKYISPMIGDKGVPIGGETYISHINNALAVMQAIMEKYSEK